MEAISFATPAHAHESNRIKLAKRINFTHRRSQTQTSGLEKLSNFDHINSDFPNKMSKVKKQLKSSTLSDGLTFQTNRKLGNFFLEYISRDQSRKSKTKMRKMKLILCKEGIEKNKDNREEQKEKSTISRRLSISHAKKISFLKKSKSSRLEGFEIDNLAQKKDDLIKGKNKTIDFQLWKIQMSKICKCIEELKNYGQVEKKINKWCISYFDTKKRNLIDIFMKKMIVTRSLNNLIVYQAICQQQILWKNIVNAAVQMPEKQQYFLGIEVSLYRGFLEEKISHKQKLELNQIQNKVKNNVEQPHLKEFARQLYQNSNSSLESGNFFVELKKIEEKYGNLELISIKNRKKFQNLNQSENNIKKIVYNK